MLESKKDNNIFHTKSKAFLRYWGNCTFFFFFFYLLVVESHDLAQQQRSVWSRDLHAGVPHPALLPRYLCSQPWAARLWRNDWQRGCLESGKRKFKPFVWIRSVYTVWWSVVCLRTALCCKLGSNSFCVHALLYNSAITLSDMPWSASSVKVSFFNRYPLRWRRFRKWAGYTNRSGADVTSAECGRWRIKPFCGACTD